MRVQFFDHEYIGLEFADRFGKPVMHFCEPRRDACRRRRADHTHLDKLELFFRGRALRHVDHAIAGDAQARIDTENGLLLIEGGVPGSRNAIVIVRGAIKKKNGGKPKAS